MSRKTDLTGKVAMITGASRGIGAAIARSLHDEGAQLSLISRSGSDLGYDDVLATACDVRSRADLEVAAAETARHFGGIDILVVNAGAGSYRPLADTSEAEIDEMIDVNVKGAIYAIKAALPHLARSPQADLVMVASEAGRRGLPGEAVYVASKFAQVGLMRSLDHELRPAGVRCTNICPGAVATDFGMGRGIRYPGMDELQNMMDPEDVAEAVMFALSRPHSHRILEVVVRHMSEQSWG
jgi:NAD(P)-dependent dehydrogenase (short-subunit alcohol dehydrogenase family)